MRVDLLAVWTVCMLEWFASARAWSTITMRMSRPKFSRPSSRRSSTTDRSGSSSRRAKPPSNNFYLPGYARADLNLLHAVFHAHATPTDDVVHENSLAYDAFVKSKYLRFWPGRKNEVEAIWMELAGGLDATDRPISFDQLPALLARLDEVAVQTEREMEEERIQWAVDEMCHFHLDTYFDRKVCAPYMIVDSPPRPHRRTTAQARGKTLSFSDFLSFESVQAELWFHDGKGVTEAAIAALWERVAGCVSRGIDKATFFELYGAVCSSPHSQQHSQQ